MANIETEIGWLNDIQIEMQDISDHFEKSIVRYEYPYVDGADLEDLGEKAGTIKVRCYFFDNAGQSTYNDHITLLNLLGKKEDLEFLHPKYGSIKGKVESVDVRHDERQRCAEVDFTFVKRGIDALEPSTAADVESATEASVSTGQNEQTDEAAADVKQSGLDATQVLDPAQNILSQIRGASSYMREAARELDAYIGELSATATEITQPVNSLIATIAYATTVPGRIVGIAAMSVERVARLYDSTASFPARFLANLNFAFAKLIEATEGFSGKQTSAARTVRTLMVKHVRLACAQRIALEAAYAYADDEKERQVVRRLEKGKSFDAAGGYASPQVPGAIMNVRELEESLASVRQWLKEGIGQARSMQSLKDMALGLLNHVSIVKLEREKIITVTIDGPLPLHLVCLKHGLPYNYAERVHSINPGMANPNRVSGEVRIYTLPGSPTEGSAKVSVA